MQQVAALVLSVMTFFSTLVASPQAFFSTNVLGDKTASTSATTNTIDTRKTTVQLRNDTLKANFEAKKAEYKKKQIEARALIETKKKEVKEKVSVLRDEKKKQIAEQVCNKFPTVNANRTDKLTNAVAYMDGLLTKVETRATDLSSSGKDVSPCLSLVSSAKQALTTAQGAITAQSAKTYSCVISSETALKTNLAGVSLALKNDMKTVTDQVLQAKTSVSNVMSCVSQLGETLSVPKSSPAL